MAAKRARGRGSSRGGAGEARSTLANDIMGVLVAVVSIAMLFSLVSPSSAPVTHAMGEALVLGFGSGAMLVPIALFVFAVTFFVRTENPVSSRIALGLGMIVLAILSILSANVVGAESNPGVVFDADSLASAGGYVGSGVAWVLLSLFGHVVTLVLLCGVIVAGVIVCGFSISYAVGMLQDKASAAAERMEERRSERLANPMPPASRVKAPKPARVAKESRGKSEAPQTTFIGARKTSVLRRDTDKTQFVEPAAKTTLLSRKRKAAKLKPNEDESELLPFDEGSTLVGVPSVGEPASSSSEAVRGNVPAFLQNKTVVAKGARKAKFEDLKTPPKKSSVVAEAPVVSPSGDDGAVLPPISMINFNPDSATSAATSEQLGEVAEKLQSTLEEFGLTSRVAGWVAGPSVTTFKIEMGEGERVNKITNLQDDIALSLAAKSVRIFAPIPGTSLVGIEIPNSKTQPVYLGDVLPFVKGGPLEAAFGRDSEGKPVVVDIASLPHLLVAGTTGSGKSVLLNSIVMTMLMRATPEELRLIMVDPKRVEFTFYAGLPHLYVPVVTEPRQATSALQWGVTEMERRLKVFEHYKVRDIRSFNGQVEGGRLSEMENPPKKMPYFVIVIDELSDLMMVAGKDVEASIVRIAQLGRAAGIHLIVATQRPSADVVTGLIKANIDNRVALSVDNSINSRIILDQTGAERLMGKGDMLYKLRGRRPKRAQACFVSEPEVEKVVEFIKEHHEADYHEDILSVVAPGKPGTSVDVAEDDDPLVWEAAQIVVDSQLGSTSGLQRRLKVGYARAGRIMDMLEQKGVVGPPDGAKPREVLLDADGLEELKSAESAYREVE